MAIKTLLKYIIPTCLFVITISCGLFDPDDERLVDPLSFSWSVDTLSYPGSFQLKLKNIWGASRKDVYAVGHNFSGAKMFHYNGKNWSPVELHTSGGGPIAGAHQIEDVHGFSDSDIWAVGHHTLDIPTDSSTIHRKIALVIHYNGYQWVESDTIHDEPLYSVGGGSSDDFWVGGLNDILYRYDGSKFTKYLIPLEINPEWFHYIGYIVGGKDGIAYAMLRIPGGGTIQPIDYLLKFEDDEWIVFDSAYADTWMRLWLSPSGTLYGAGYFHLDRWENGSRTTLMDSTYYAAAHGTGDDNFYVVGNTSPMKSEIAVWYYNGEEFRQLPIPKVENGYAAGVWTDGTEVFVLAVIGNSTVVLHGK
ncbi:hypothetical protein ACFL6E_03055 [Candidatus Neomarinimicrobiota bacterium]